MKRMEDSDEALLCYVRQLLNESNLSDAVGIAVSISKNGEKVFAHHDGYSLGIRESRSVRFDSNQIADCVEVEVYHECETLERAFVEDGRLREHLFYEELDIEHFYKCFYDVCKGENIKAGLSYKGTETDFVSPDETVTLTRVNELTAKLSQFISN